MLFDEMHSTARKPLLCASERVVAKLADNFQKTQAMLGRKKNLKQNCFTVENN
jgi:hypothetical protein